MLAVASLIPVRNNSLFVGVGRVVSPEEIAELPVKFARGDAVACERSGGSSDRLRLSHWRRHRWREEAVLVWR